MVVERADLLGLGQMHQLRGRVGRSGSRAYAYLFHPRDARLTEEAYERLRTIGEATDLGSGFKIAMRDLEIRGAGNLLGESQSGHIAAVGYDLYCQMVTEAVGEMKGEPPKEPSELKLDVPTDAYLPNDYVTKEESRLEAYRRLAAVTTAAEVDDIRSEWEDRYGPVPDAGRRVVERRLPARRVPPTGSARRLDRRRARHVSRRCTLKTSAEMRLQRLARNAIFKPDSQQLVVPIPRDAEPAEFLVGFLRELVPAHETAHRQAGRARRAGRLALHRTSRRLDDPRTARSRRACTGTWCGWSRSTTRPTSSRSFPTIWPNANGDCCASSATPDCRRPR